jgi:hypothetical protein
VKYSSGPLAEACDPTLVISIYVSSLQSVKPPGLRAIVVLHRTMSLSCNLSPVFRFR